MPKITDRPRYYRVRRTRAFWEPGAWGARFGFAGSVPLGEDGPDAKAKAIHWNAKLDAARATADQPPVPAKSSYPPGSLGSFFEKWTGLDGGGGSEAWRLKAPRTQAEYIRSWPHIAKRFGGVLITRISPVASEQFHVDIHPSHPRHPQRDPKGAMKLGHTDAHRVLKNWRSILQALVAHGLLPTAPIGQVSNPAPPGREELWLHDEVMDLAQGAAFGGYFGLAVALLIIWDAMLSPVDGRTLTWGRWRRTEDGAEIAVTRAKTGRKTWASVTQETAQAVDVYRAWLESNGAPTAPEDLMIRRPATNWPPRWRDTPGPYTANLLAKHFAVVREAVFPGDERQLLDLRRAGLTEARTGGAELADLGRAAANSLDKNEALQSTYIRASSKKVQTARRAGRAEMVKRFRNDAD